MLSSQLARTSADFTLRRSVLCKGTIALKSVSSRCTSIALTALLLVMEVVALTHSLTPGRAFSFGVDMHALAAAVPPQIPCASMLAVAIIAVDAIKDRVVFAYPNDLTANNLFVT
jgi:hypothetical protein